MNYVGVLKISSNLIMVQCKRLWFLSCVSGSNERTIEVTPLYVRDDVEFFIVNFFHKLPLLSKPFIFPSQATQVFFLWH
jgi:hypothetical protein